MQCIQITNVLIILQTTIISRYMLSLCAFQIYNSFLFIYLFFFQMWLWAERHVHFNCFHMLVWIYTLVLHLPSMLSIEFMMWYEWYDMWYVTIRKRGMGICINFTSSSLGWQILKSNLHTIYGSILMLLNNRYIRFGDLDLIKHKKIILSTEISISN